MCELRDPAPRLPHRSRHRQIARDDVCDAGRQRNGTRIGHRREQALGDLAYRALSNRLDAVLLQMCGNQVLRSRRIGRIELGHEVRWQTLDGRCRSNGEAPQLGPERFRPPEQMTEPRAPAIGNFQSGQQGVEQTEIAKPQLHPIDACRAYRTQRNEQDLRIGRNGISGGK